MTNSKAVLKSVFGYNDFRGYQEQAITDLIDGCDVVTIMPTGGGKSLCYQIPAMLRKGCGIVISPLIALMQDQVTAVTENGVRAAFLNSSLNQGQQAEVETSFRRGELDLLYIAPERFRVASTREMLDDAYQNNNIALFAIDEAHCVSQWGHDFRPDYLDLHYLCVRWKGVPRIALTATATPETKTEIINKLALTNAKVYADSFDRPNITYHIEPKIKGKSFEQLLAFLELHRGESGIVYSQSRASVDKLAGRLKDNGFDVVAYHAGLNNNLRKEAQDRFLREDGVIVVATVAFGMGIDKPDIRFVAHADVPKSMEGYSQETGRAGRDGLPAVAWMNYSYGDIYKQKMFANRGNSEPNDFDRMQLYGLDKIANFSRCDERAECRRKQLLAHFGEYTTTTNCGGCDVCLNLPSVYTPPPPGVRSSVTNTSSKPKKSAAAPDIELTTEQAELFEKLRAWRYKEAQKREVPAYVVFDNKTLKALAIHRPATLEQMLDISGVGEMKLREYGEEVLHVLQI